MHRGSFFHSGIATEGFKRNKYNLEIPRTGWGWTQGSWKYEFNHPAKKKQYNYAQKSQNAAEETVFSGKDRIILNNNLQNTRWFQKLVPQYPKSWFLPCSTSISCKKRQRLQCKPHERRPCPTAKPTSPMGCPWFTNSRKHKWRFFMKLLT